MTWWVGLIELGLFVSLSAVVLWVCFGPVKTDQRHQNCEGKYDE